MSKAIEAVLRPDGADTEVELSAQDLLALSDLAPLAQPETGQPSRLEAYARGRGIDATGASAGRFVRALRLPFSLFVAISIIGGAYVLTPSTDTSPATAGTSARAVQSPWPAPEQKAEGEPVLFANPFDAEEVFEFPPGTSMTEARDAVAELLTERAISRQQT